MGSMVEVTAEERSDTAMPAPRRAAAPAAKAARPGPRSVLPATAPAPLAAPPAAPRRRLPDRVLYLGLVLMVLGAWGITQLGLYDTKSDFAYWLGVAGGVMMLLLLSYPLRKYWRFMARFGAARGWFIGHMVLGIGGPLLILLHSNFTIGSLNAGVAFFSMVTVALSGIAGRFLYVRLHQNLNGVKVTLSELREVLDVENAAAARLRFAPAVIETLQGFDEWAKAPPSMRPGTVARNLLLLPLRRWRAEWQCQAELRRRLVVVAHSEGWSRRKFGTRLKASRTLVHDYLEAAQRLAQFSVWERLFSWWHVAHVPIVYMLIISAIAHIVAVHVY
jgi:hypothetical protein